jgi:Kef-type K+ transport system membrane component KefB
MPMAVEGVPIGVARASGNLCASHYQLGGRNVDSVGVLDSIAEVAIALAGFGGIAAGLGYRARGVWSTQDRLRLVMLASVSLTVVLACFLPHAIHHLGVTPPWRLASAVFLPIQTLALLASLWRNRRGVPAGFSRIAAGLVFITQSAAAVLLAITVLGNAVPHEFGFYLSAILFTLFYASLFFVRLLITSFRDSDPAA